MPRKSQTRASAFTKDAPSGETTHNIPLQELIQVVSLLDYPLVMMSVTGGRSKYRFQSFGETKLILYQDVIQIIEEHRSFLEKGYFVIMDARVIERHGLQQIMSNLLKRDDIIKILSGVSDALTLFTSCNKDQQATIVGMLTRKLTENPDSVDLNVVNQISRASGVDILRNADDALEVLKSREGAQ